MHGDAVPVSARPGGDLGATCHALADQLVAAGFDLPSVYLLVGSRLRCYAARGYYQVVDGFPPGTGIIGEVVARGVSAFIPDVRAHSDFIAAVPGLRAEACAPVRVGDVVVGAVNVESRTVLPVDVLIHLEAAADRLGRQIAALGGIPQPTLAQRLAQITLEISETTEASDIEASAVRGAVETTGMSSAAIAHLAPGRPEVRTATGPLAERLRAWRLEEIETMARWVRAGTSSHFPGGGDSTPAEYRFLRTSGVHALSVHPLLWRGNTTGLLLVADSDPVAHAPDVVEVLEMLAAQTASQLAVASLVEELARLAQQDGLTGLNHTASFSADLAARAAPNGKGGSLLLIDIDHFKAVNDTHGHLAGDTLLKSLSHGMTDVVRAGERLYRIGGDEFAALVDSTRLSDVDALSQRLLSTARRLGVSVSIGTCPVLTGSPDDTRRAADAALYGAKRAGRDTVRHHQGTS